jgi:uncharacterized phage protein gp47/JayE
MAYTKSYDNLMQESLAALTSQTNITQLVPGAKARALLEILNTRLAGAYQYLDQTVLNLWLATATGTYLELLGDLLACPRLISTFASASAWAENVAFSVASGTFGDLNNGHDITVPAGTILSTLGTAASYRTTQTITLPAAGTSAYVDIEAVLPGTAGIVGANTLTTHNLTAYPGLLVNNAVAINNASDQESDDAYRYRLTQKVTASAMANETAVRQACLAVPGVADVMMVPYVQGAGTFEVYVIAMAGETTSTLLELVQTAINTTQAYGCQGTALAPRQIGIQFQAVVYSKQNLDNVAQSILQEQLQQATQDYFSTFTLQQSFLVNNFFAALVRNSVIKTIGAAGKPFSQLYVWKPSRLNNGRQRYSSTGDYNTAVNERVQLENQAGLTAADFRIVIPS